MIRERCTFQQAEGTFARDWKRFVSNMSADEAGRYVMKGKRRLGMTRCNCLDCICSYRTQSVIVVGRSCVGKRTA